MIAPAVPDTSIAGLLDVLGARDGHAVAALSCPNDAWLERGDRTSCRLMPLSCGCWAPVMPVTVTADLPAEAVLLCLDDDPEPVAAVPDQRLARPGIPVTVHTTHRPELHDQYGNTR